MFIREDLSNEIKKFFNIEELNYNKAIKTLYDETLLLFNAKGRTIVIEFEEENSYYIYEVEKEPRYGGSCIIVSRVIKLFVDQKETRLKMGLTTISFPGKAFDCAGELVLLAMEEGIN